MSDGPRGREGGFRSYRAILVGFFFTGLLGCRESGSSIVGNDRAPSEGAVDASGVLVSPLAETATRGVPSERDPKGVPGSSRDSGCSEKIQETLKLPALPGALSDPSQRALLFSRGKGEPVLFLERPEFSGDVSKGIETRRTYLENTRFQLDATRKVLTTFEAMVPELRQLLLRDGYLYTEDPETARELTVRVGLEDLFVERSLTILRGSESLVVEKDPKGKYRYALGENKGRLASLYLMDRVWVTGEDPGPVRHVDLRSFVNRFGFDDVRVVHLTAHRAVVSLNVGGVPAQALLRLTPPNAELECLSPATSREELADGEKRAQLRARVMGLLRSAVVEQVRAGLPFDEPKTEIGQQDGKLRDLWEQSYFSGRSEFELNGDKYRVFDSEGQPRTPQVCIDFVTETLERASGMSFAARGNPRKKNVGTIDFDVLLGEGRRRETALREYAKVHEDEFTLLDIPEDERVRYEKVGTFFETLAKKRADYQVGDIVIIRGRAKWDFYAEVHTHTFFIYEVDPLSGMPILIAGNSGKPRILTWDAEMLRAPKRAIVHRIRPRLGWLADRLEGQLSRDPAPVPLVAFEG